MNGTKEALLVAMEVYFNGDIRRIEHARQVTEYAEQLRQKEGGDYLVVAGAAVLHDIGIHQAEEKYGSSSGKYQEIEGPPIARQILTELGFEPGQIESICQIIAHHHSPGKITTRDFSLVYDADWLVNLEDEYDIGDQKRLNSVIDTVFLTKSGKTLAKEIYLEKT
ncbi:MAG TPA: HD domain-containing protein [Dehalococcoidales bacterium]|jgi:hypothetical protein|nr:HD domain-containing protein [Dehalococcoidales bacterium]